MKPTTSERPASSWQPLVVLVALSAVLTWAYWPAITAMAVKWAADPQYSHGFLVPLFAVYLLWHRRAILGSGPLRPSWACVPLLLIGIGMRLPTEMLNFALEWFEGLSLILTLAGLCLLLGGGPALRWAWPSLLFLFFMLPLPFNVERALALELRWVATQFSTYVLQTLGFAAVAEGNTILLDTQSVGVEEACSGLSMLLTFVALAVAVVVLFDLSILERVLILLSALPIAVLANSVRIIVTAVFMEKWDPDLAYQFFHNYAGWLMMVFALVVLYLEVVLFRHLVVATPPPTLRLTSDPRAAMFRPYPIVVAFLVVLTSGIVHGVWANRWGPSADLERARERMETVPGAFGEWEMVGESQVSLKEQQIAGIVAYKRREYRHKRTGKDVSVLLVCGRPGAIAVHTPDVCYEGAGFRLAGTPAKDTVALPGGLPLAELNRGQFTKPVAGVPRHLLAFWSWNGGRAWEAPDKPRFHFLGTRVLHKLYVSREVTGEEAETEPCVDFLRAFLPVLHQALFVAPPEPERT